jgi:hypothetical protein
MNYHLLRVEDNPQQSNRAGRVNQILNSLLLNGAHVEYESVLNKGFAKETLVYPQERVIWKFSARIEAYVPAPGRRARDFQ